MAVRRFTQDNRIGYGVVGGAISSPTEAIILSLPDISTEIPLPSAEPFAPFTPYVTHFVYLQWRFSVDIDIADMELIKQYFAPLGRSQFGRFAISAYGYVTDEGFISYAKFKSPLYTCVVRYDDGERFDGVPCDEPQTDEFDGEPEEGEWTAYSGSPAVVSSVSAATIGDGVGVWLPETIALANVGLTYSYRIIPYTNSELIAANFPNRLIF